MYVLCLKLWFECCDFGLIFPLFGRFNSFSMDGWCFSLVLFHFLVAMLSCSPGYLFYIARLLAAKSGTRIAAPSVYVIFAGGG